jgi:hypothetical protein
MFRVKRIDFNLSQNGCHMDHLQTCIAKHLIAEVVQTERAARDLQQWERMQNCFHADSIVDISWFHGTGPEFVAASKKMFEQGARSAHQVGSSICEIVGNRAIAETGCVISINGAIAGVEVVVNAHSRLYERLECREGQWRLSGMRIVYIQDQLNIANPGEKLALVSERLARYRPSYRFLSYLLEEGGYPPSSDLPGNDRRETVQALVHAENAWLNEA